MYTELFFSDISRYLRDYWQSVGFTLTDSELATVIWNSPKRTLDEKLSALNEIIEKTCDSDLKMRIAQRLEKERTTLAAVKDNACKKYVYAVVDDSNDICGYFGDYDTAFEFIQFSTEKYSSIGITYSIEKHLLLAKTEFDSEINKANMEYPSAPAGVVVFDKNVEILSVSSNEVRMVETDCTKSFENQFFRIPLDLPAHAVQVRDLIENKYGVLCFSGSDVWESLFDSLEKRNVPLDYYDIQTPVFFLTEQGFWSHEHINPMYLELECYKANGERKSEAFRCATEAFLHYLNNPQDNISAAKAICYAKEYRDICMENDRYIKAEEENDINYIIC